jgi:predicted nucleic acid-binding protein
VIVIDASALLEVLLRTPVGALFERRLLDAPQLLHAPHLLDVELTQVLRRFVLTRDMAPERARAALDDLLAFPIRRHAHEMLVPLVWELRDNFTAYDATYVALAEALEGTLLTHDRRLAAAARKLVPVELA